MAGPGGLTSKSLSCGRPMLVSADSQVRSGSYARGALHLLGWDGHDLEKTSWERQHRAEPLRTSNLDKRNSNFIHSYCQATAMLSMDRTQTWQSDGNPSSAIGSVGDLGHAPSALRT